MRWFGGLVGRGGRRLSDGTVTCETGHVTRSEYSDDRDNVLPYESLQHRPRPVRERVSGFLGHGHCGTRGGIFSFDVTMPLKLEAPITIHPQPILFER